MSDHITLPNGTDTIPLEDLFSEVKNGKIEMDLLTLTRRRKMGEDLIKRNEHNFKTHRLDDNGVMVLEDIRTECHQLADKLVGYLGNGRELAAALTNLEQVMFWANAGYSRKEGK